jgi:hypothetical protein
MTTTGPAHPPTALTLLFGSEGDAPRVIGERLLAVAGDSDLGRALEKLPQVMSEAAARELAAATAGLLNLNLPDVIVAGWRAHAELVAAARRTLASPGSTEFVGLAAHSVTVTQEPYVTLLADGHRIATLRLELSLVLGITAVVARVSAGRLTALESGHCDITATLAMQGIDVETKQTRLELPGVITLGTGIPLLPSHPASTDPASERLAPLGPGGTDLANASLPDTSPASGSR